MKTEYLTYLYSISFKCRVSLSLLNLKMPSLACFIWVFLSQMTSVINVLLSVLSVYASVCGCERRCVCVCVSCFYCSLLWRVLCFCHCITTGALLTSTPFVRPPLCQRFSFFCFLIFELSRQKRSILIQTSSVSFYPIQLSLALGSAHPSPS